MCQGLIKSHLHSDNTSFIERHILGDRTLFFIIQYCLCDLYMATLLSIKASFHKSSLKAVSLTSMLSLLLPAAIGFLTAIDGKTLWSISVDAGFEGVMSRTHVLSSLLPKACLQIKSRGELHTGQKQTPVFVLKGYSNCKGLENKK